MRTQVHTHWRWCSSERKHGVVQYPRRAIQVGQLSVCACLLSACHRSDGSMPSSAPRVPMNKAVIFDTSQSFKLYRTVATVPACIARLTFQCKTKYSWTRSKILAALTYGLGLNAHAKIAISCIRRYFACRTALASTTLTTTSFLYPFTEFPPYRN